MLDALDAVGASDVDAFRFALAALLFVTKDTPAAIRRCRARMTRAIEGLEEEVDGPTGRAAEAALRIGCAACGKCPGVASIRPPRPSVAA